MAQRPSTRTLTGAVDACRSSKREPRTQGPRKRSFKYGMRRLAWGGNSMRQGHFENTRDLSRTRYNIVELSAQRRAFAS